MAVGPKKLVAGGLVAAGVASAAAGWMWWGPSVVAGRVEAALSRRGFNASVGDVDLMWSGARLSDVTFNGHGVTGAFDELDALGSLWSIIREGAGAVRQVEVRGGHVEVSGPEALGDWYAEHSEDSSSPSSSSARAFPNVELTGLEFVLRDEAGVLAHAAVGGTWRDGQITAQVASGSIGEAPGNVVEVEAAAGRAERADDGWAIKGVEATGLLLRLGSEDHVTRSRVETLLEARNSADSAPEGGAETDPLRRMRDGAVLRVDSARVVRGDDVVLESLSARVSRNGEDLEFTGEGRGAGASASWDLVVDPSQPSIRGSLSVDELPLDVLAPFLPEVPWWRPEAARVGASLEVEAASDGVLNMSGRLQLANVALNHERLSPNPIEDIGFVADGRASLDLVNKSLTVAEATVRVREASVRISGEATRTDERWTLQVDGVLPPTECNDAMGAIPSDLLAETAGFTWSGRLQASAHLKIDSDDFRRTELSIDVDNRCQFQTVPAAADIRRVQGAFLHRVVEPDGGMFEMMAGAGSANWTPMGAISPFLVHAVIGHEDAGFLHHHGFATYAIRDALARNLREGRYVVGASTITMQLTKNLFLHREKTLARKVQEVLLTWWVESALTKMEILELYLNIIEYGPRVYGISHAADHYFGRAPADLTVAESAFFATILPNPKAFHELYVRGSLGTQMTNRLSRFLRHLHERGRIDQVALEDGLQQLGEGLRFARDGSNPARPVMGTASSLPFATARPGEPLGYDPFEMDAEPYEDYDQESADWP